MSHSSSDTEQFGWVRSLIWPVHRHELKKLIPMLFIFFFISFSYHILRIMKDTLVVTADFSGAEIIPFIKVWAMFPGAILMTYVFTRLSNRFSREFVFYTIISFFLVYFTLFAFVFYPNRGFFQPHHVTHWLQTVLPLGCKGLIAMIHNWTFTIFYVMAELWSNIVLTVIVWGLANQITKLAQAKRFYGIFALAANFSGIASGFVSVFLSRCAFNPALPFGSSAWEQSMVMLISLTIFSGIISLFLFRWMNKNVLRDPSHYNINEAVEEKEVRGRLSLRQSFIQLLQSKYLVYITLIVIGYNVVMNLTEVIWKDQVKELYPNPEDFNLYLNQVSTMIGVVSTVGGLFITASSIRKFGWTFTAMLTPLVLLATSIAFFGLFFSKQYFHTYGIFLFGLSPLAAIVSIGSLQNILARSAKYTVFDATKEMAFVPLSLESQLKGKAAIDGICNRLGKSGGSIIHQGLLIMFSSFAVSAPYVSIILLLIIAAWMGSVRLLGKEFDLITATPEKAETSFTCETAEAKPA